MVVKESPVGRRLCNPATKQPVTLSLVSSLLLLSSAFFLAPDCALAEDSDCSQTAPLLARIEQLELRIKAMETKVSAYESLFGLVERQRLGLENVRKQQESDYRVLEQRLDRLQAGHGTPRYKPARLRQ